MATTLDRLKRLTIYLLFVACLLAIKTTLTRQGYVLVDFKNYKSIENEVLNSPIRIVKIENENILLQDNQKIRFTCDYGKLSSHTLFLQLEAAPDGEVFVYTSGKHWYCGNAKREPTPLIRIPILPKTIPENYKVLAGKARFVEG